MAKLHYEIGKAELKDMVLKHLGEILKIPLKPEDVRIEVITLDNYRAKEWENGDFRAVVDKNP